MKKWTLLLLLAASTTSYAGDVEILKVVLKQQGSRWSADVTLEHDDEGWDHYADGWRIVDEQGEELGMRVLYHPHVNEQPFTRSLSAIHFAEDQKIVYVEARDKKHGWSKQRLKIDLSRSSGDKYTVIRK